jgi:hypothetical protein
MLQRRCRSEHKTDAQLSLAGTAEVIGAGRKGRDQRGVAAESQAAE